MEIKNNDAKVLLKITDPETNASRWVHLCYVDDDIYREYLQYRNETICYMNEILSRWAAEDFKVTLSMNSIEDILALKSLVKEFYREKYPEVFRDSTSDRQGWLRIWMNNKMQEELKNANR